MNRYVVAFAMGAIFTAAAARAEPADWDTERVSVELDAGFLTGYDETHRWDGGYEVGVSGLWALGARVQLGARFSVMHWSYNPQPDIEAIVPAWADLLFQKSTGQTQVVSLVPFARWEHDEVVGRLGVFVQAGAGGAYVSQYSRLELEYGTGASGEAVIHVLDESGWHVEGVVAAGLTRPLSSGWIELIPSCRWIFEDETVRVLGLSFGFRTRV